MKNLIILITFSLMLFSCRLPWQKPSNGGGGGGSGPIVISPSNPEPSPTVPISCFDAKVKDCVGELTDPPSGSRCPTVIVDEGGFEFPAISTSTKRKWKPEYTSYFADSTNNDPLAKSLLDDGMFRDSELSKLGCTGYKTATDNEKKIVLLNILAALGIKESGYDPSQDTYECGNPFKLWTKLYKVYPSSWSLTKKQSVAAKTLGVNRCWISSGLFQMTRSTVERSPYSCKFKKSGWQAMHDPEDNIKCALRVLATQTKKCGGLFCHRREHHKYTYFGPLRREKDINDIAGLFKKQLRNMPFCDPDYRKGRDVKIAGKIGHKHTDTKCEEVVETDRNDEIEFNEVDKTILTGEGSKVLEI